MKIYMVTWDYIAGFFDGEGCITFNKTNGIYTATIVQKDKTPLIAIIRFLKQYNIKCYFGGHSKTTEYQKHKTVYWDLRISCHKCLLRFLDNIIPRLNGEKKVKCKQAVKFIINKRWLNNKKHCNENISN